MSLNFSNLHVSLNKKKFDSIIILNSVNNSGDKFSYKGTHYLIDKENIDDKYLWMHFRYGKSFPRSNTVYNTRDRKEEDNPRSVEQVEPCEQLFVLYCADSRTLYVSDVKKKAFIQHYFRKKTSENIEIRTFLSEVDDFLSKIKSVSRLHFVKKSNLLHDKKYFGSIMDRSEGFCGLGASSVFTLDLRFKNAAVTRKFIEFMKHMVGARKRFEVDSIMCAGLDERRFETIFNIESFITKINIDASKDDQGIYDSELVKRLLIEKIREEDEERS